MSISKGIFEILSDSNFKKYAVIKPTNISNIIKINDWAKEKSIKYYVLTNIIFLIFNFNILKAEVVKN